jgi:XRE family transcriptional regulator, regulator of sulfur utilization
MVSWNDAAARRHAAGFMMPFVNRESCGARQITTHVSVIDPGQAAHLPHAHAGEEVMFVLEGQGEFTVGEERHLVGPMSALFCPEHVLHGLRNTGPTPIKYVVFRVVT